MKGGFVKKFFFLVVLFFFCTCHGSFNCSTSSGLLPAFVVFAIVRVVCFFFQ